MDFKARHTRGELDLENLDFLNMRRPGQSTPTPRCSLEMGKMKIGLKDVGVRFPAL